jgi:hypothetical protein
MSYSISPNSRHRCRLTSIPKTPSRSPTASFNFSTAAKNASCRYSWILTFPPFCPSTIKEGAYVDPPQNKVLTHQSGQRSLGDAHFMVAQASFWYPVGQSPRSPANLPPLIPSKKAAPLRESFSPSSDRSKPAASSVQPGAPDCGVSLT